MDPDRAMREMVRSIERSADPPGERFDVVVRRIRRRRSRRYFAGVAAIGLLAAGVIVPISGLMPIRGDNDDPVRAAGDSVPVVVGTQEIAIEGGITDVATGFGSVWVPGSGVVTRVDGATGAVTATIDVPGSSDYRSVAVGDGAVWVTDSGKASLFRIDPSSNRLTATIKLDGPPLRVIAAGASVWVTVATEGVGEVVRIDPRTDSRSGEPVMLEGPPGRLSYLHGSIWIENTSDAGSVARIDPATLKETQVAMAAFPQAMGGGSLWSAEDGTVARINPTTAVMERTLTIPRASSVVVGDGGVWVLSDAASTSTTTYEPDPARPARVQLIDPTTDAATGGPIAVGRSPGFLAFGSGSVWFGAFSDSTLTRVEVTVGT